MMNCDKILDLIELYIMNELNTSEKEIVEYHLKNCITCTIEYEKTKSMIEKLQSLGKSIKVKEDILSMNRRNIINNTVKRKNSFFKFIYGTAACVFLGLFFVASSFIAFPTLAFKYAPELPVVREFKQIQQQNEDIKKQIKEVKQENEKLKMQIKNINGTDIKEIVTSEGIPAEENYAVQKLVLDFIKAQYKGDIDAIKSMCTDEFRKTIDKRRDEIINDKFGDVIFSTITNVAKDGDKYLVFVRLTDTGSVEKGEAEYQEDFELYKVDGKFLVSFVGKDA